MVPCPDKMCSGCMTHWQHSIRWRCDACKRFFDFVAVPVTVDPTREFPPPVATEGRR